MFTGIVLLVLSADVMMKLAAFIGGIFLLLRGLSYNRGSISSIFYSLRSRFFDRF
jgi:hypothetical protein